MSRRCFLVLLSLLASCACSAVLAQAPQNHAVVPDDAECVAANLAPTDFCAQVINYPISSTLLRTSGALSSLHRPQHEQLLKDNRLEVLSERAQAEFNLLMEAHLEAANVAADKPGGVRHAARAQGVEDFSTVLLPQQHSCEHMLQRYACQNQFPRCVDDAFFTDSGRPIELHTCYSLCHDVRNTCSLAHRLDCSVHHSSLNPLYTPPSEHELRYDARFADGQDPYAEFWQVDCIDSPPSMLKRLVQFMLYGGPAKWVAYSLAALAIYALISMAMGGRNSSETSAATWARVRKERRTRRAVFDAKMRQSRKKYVKLQEIKTVMIDAQTADVATLALQKEAALHLAFAEEEGTSAPSPRVATLAESVSDRATKLAQIDQMILALESSIAADIQTITSARLEEVREDYAAGRIPPSIDEDLIRQYVAGEFPQALSVGSIEGVSDELADGSASEEEEASLLGDRSSMAHEEPESEKVFGKRRRHATPNEETSSSRTR